MKTIVKKSSYLGITAKISICLYSILITLLLTSSATAAIEAAKHTLEIGQSYTLSSKYLKEDRPYSVYLPEVCKTGGASAPCPTLYILDGERTFHHASGVLQTMSSNTQIPEMIMVAIANTTDRTRDLTPTHSLDDGFGRQDPTRSTSGGGERFLDFIEHELIPEIDERYQPMPYKVLVGHSFGGLFTLHSLVTRPELFQAHLAIDASLYWDNNQWLKQAEETLRQSKNIKNRVYLSTAEYAPKGELDVSNRFERPGERFAYALNASASPQLHSAYQQFAGEDHGSVGLPSLYYGLKFIFEGYKTLPPLIESQGLDAVKTYYKNYLAPYGIKLRPPQAVIYDLAFLAESNGRYDEAIEYHKYNIKNHPKFAHGHYTLAKTYALAGEKTQAITHFEKALKLEPKMAAYIRPWLMKLKKR